jgi:hypothetical protein
LTFCLRPPWRKKALPQVSAGSAAFHAAPIHPPSPVVDDLRAPIHYLLVPTLPRVAATAST